MTTIAIQQRAGGDTVRALGELAATLDARKDLRREVTTLLSGVVFTSYVVAGIGGGTILLLNVMSPGVTKEMTSSLIGHRWASRRRHPVDDRVRADPQDDEGSTSDGAVLVRRAWPRCSSGSASPRSRCCATRGRWSGSAAASAACASRPSARSVTAKLVEALAARLGPRLAPSLRASRRAALEHSSTTRAARAG